MSEGGEVEMGLTLLTQLKSELKEHADHELGQELLHHMERFVKTADDNWVDLMVWRVSCEGLPLPVTIQCLAARVAHARLLGKGSRRKTSKVMTEHTGDLKRAVMAAQIGLGNTHAKASQQAINAVHDVCGTSGAASGLDKKFPAYKREMPLGDALSAHFKVEATRFPAEAQALQVELAKLPQRAPGVRR